MSQVRLSPQDQKTASNLSEFHAIARAWTQKFSPRSVVALSGELGVGKTEFVRAVAEALGIQGLASPTFAIHHRYQNMSTTLDHLDLYRLKNEDELESTGFWDLFSQKQGLILIEWPERLDLSHIPHAWDLFVVEIRQNPEDSRQLSLSRRD